MENPRRPSYPQNAVQIQMSYLNQEATGEYSAGTRPYGFVSSIGREFMMQGATVMDHWKGLIDTSPYLSEQELADYFGDRELPLPTEAVTRNQALRLVDRYDRESQMAVYEQGVGSVIGGLIGGVAPWAASPESIPAYLFPPIRAVQLGQQTTRGARIGTRIVQEMPLSAAMGTTNILAQEAAYGNVDAVEAIMVTAAPVVFGAGAAFLRDARMSRAAAQSEASLSEEARPPLDPHIGPREFEVPPALQNEFQQWAKIQPTDGTDVALQKIATALETSKVPTEIGDYLIEAYARTGAARSNSIAPELRAAVQKLAAAESRAVQTATPEIRARIAELDSKLAKVDRSMETAQRRLREAAAQAGALPAMAKLPRNLAGAKPRYGFGNKQFDLEFASDVDKAAFIIRDAKKKSKADAAYVQFVKDNTNLDEAGARRYGQQVANRIKEQARDAEVGEPLYIEADVAPQNLTKKMLSDDMRRLHRERTALAKERNKYRDDAPDALSLGEKDALTKTALAELAGALARNTDQPLPAEFVAEVLTLAKLKQPVTPDAVSGLRVSTASVDYIDVNNIQSQSLQDMIKQDPALAAMRSQPGFKNAIEAFSRFDDILKGCDL